MKNIIIAGSSRAGKSTLARLLNMEFGYFVLSVDKLVGAFSGAYPQLDIRFNWDREKVTENIAPFLGHFLGMFSSPDGRGLLPYSHGRVAENRFVLEGAYVDIAMIQSVLKTYGMENLSDNFHLIGLVQNDKTVDDFISDMKKYDTEDDWTYGFDESEMREFSEDQVDFSRRMTEHLTQFGFKIYDTSKERERVLTRIIEEIKAESL